MMRDEAVALIKKGLGYTTAHTASIVEKLVEAQVDEEQGARLPEFLITEVSSRQSVIGEERLAKPTDYIRGVEEDALWYYNADATDSEDVWVPLQKTDLQDLRHRYPGEGPPEAYAEIGNYFRIGPTPDDTYTFKQIYYAKDAVLTSNVENKWLENAPYLLIGIAGRRMAEDLGNADAAGKFARRETSARSQLFLATEAAEHANQRYIMGDPD